MEKRYVIAMTGAGYWGEGESISVAADRLPTVVQADDAVMIMAVPGEGVDRLSVDKLGRISAYGPNQDEAMAALEEVYVGPWGQRSKGDLKVKTVTIKDVPADN